MAEEEIGKEALPPLLSINDVKPIEQGGPIARSGFNYQDEIAVGFFLEMLEDSGIVKVHCETHDDIVLVRIEDGLPNCVAEYVQVKAAEMDKLWSVADISARKKGKSGTSIFELSLDRDRHIEVSRFRLVTLRPVVNDLEVLTLKRGAPGREINGVYFKSLVEELEKRFPDLKSTKGNGAEYWVENCCWDVRHSEESVRNGNLLRLLRLSGKDGCQLLPEQAVILLDELRVWAKDAGSAKWDSDRDRKIIPREELRHWWEKRTREVMGGVASPSGGKLAQKMNEAELPAELIGLAIEMRRDYSLAVRTSRYMETEEQERLQCRVKSEVMSLRSRFAAGELNLDGPAFHALCVDRMDMVNADRVGAAEDRSAFLKGCMYDIADRCLLRFSRPIR